MMKFEYRKWLKSYKTLVLLSLTFLLLTFFFAHVTQKEKQVRANYLVSVEDTFYELVALSDQAAAAPTDEMTETQIQQNERMNDEYSQALTHLNKHSAAYQKDDWREAVSEYILYLKSSVLIENLGGQIVYPEEDIQKLIDKNQYLLDENIPPTNLDASTNALYFVKNSMDYFFSYGGILLIILLFFDLFAKEYEQNTIKLLKLLPIKKGKIYANKVRLSLFITVALPLIIASAALLISWLYSRNLGDLQYPILLEIKNQAVEVVTLKQYLLQSFVFFELVTLTTLFTLAALSKLKKDSFLTLIGTTFIMGFPTLFIDEFYSNLAYTKLLPFYYVNLYQKSKNMDIADTVFQDMRPFFGSLLVTASLFLCLNYFGNHYLARLNKQR